MVAAATDPPEPRTVVRGRSGGPAPAPGAGWANGQLAADRAAINLADLEQADPTTTGSPRPVKELT